jgi:hypothetical protein
LPASLLEQVEKHDSDYGIPTHNRRYETKSFQRVFQQWYFFEHVIILVKVFWVAQQRFPLNSRIYEQVILSICGLVTLGIGSLVLPIS